MADPTELVRTARTIAVVGASTDPDKAANHVPAALQRAGRRIIPVNPGADEILGEPVHTRLDELSEPVDVVEVFRPAEEAPDIARQAVAIGAKAVWLQLGITSPEARRVAEDAGLDYVEDACMGQVLAAIDD